MISSGITNIILPLTVSGDDNQLLEEFAFVVSEATLLLVGKAIFATTLASSNSRVFQGIIQVKLILWYRSDACPHFIPIYIILIHKEPHHERRTESDTVRDRISNTF